MRSLFDEVTLERHQRWIVDRSLGCQLASAGVELVGGRADNATLVGASFSDCIFRDVTFSKVDLTDVELESCVFEDCRFEGCAMQQARLLNCRFERASLAGCGLQSWLALDTQFIEVDFSEASLYKSVFERCVFKSSRFVGSKLKRAELNECQLPACVLARVNAEHASFRKTNLMDCDFSDLALDHTFFWNCALRGIHGKPQFPEHAYIIEPDYSELGDGSLLVSEEQVKTHWGHVPLAAAAAAP